MDQPIICAIDETTSEAVVETAAELARATDARLLLVHVVPDPPLFNDKAERERDRNRAIRPGLALLADAAESLPSGVEWDSRVELGDPAAKLREAAEKTDASLLVVGSRGRGLVASALLGSVSRALGREAPCPVGIVPRHVAADGGTVSEEAASAIVVGVGQSGRSGHAAALATKLAAGIGGRLILVPGPGNDVPPAHVLESVAVHEGASLVMIDTDGATETRGAALVS